MIAKEKKDNAKEKYSMAIFDMTAAVELTKRMYPNGLEELLIEKSPALGMIKKRTDFVGEGEYLLWEIANFAGQSSTFTNALGNRNAIKMKRPFIQHKKEYAAVELDFLTFRAARGAGAVLSAWDTIIRGGVKAIEDSLSVQFYGNGGGARGRILSSSIDGSNTILTLYPGQATYFQEGLVLQTFAGNGLSGSIGSDTMTVDGVDYDNNTITVTTADAALKTTGYYIFREGDFGKSVLGLGAWNPVNAPVSGESFCGIDRSTSPQKMAGLRYVPGSGNIDEILLNAQGRLSRAGGSADICFMSPTDFTALAIKVNSQRTADVRVQANLTGGRTASIGYDGLGIMGPAGKVTVLPDPWCPVKQCWMGKLDTLEIWSVGSLIDIDKDDGNMFVRRYDADSADVRFKAYLNIVNKNPSTWITITLP